MTCLKVTPSRKLPQTLASTTSKWRLTGEERAQRPEQYHRRASQLQTGPSTSRGSGDGCQPEPERGKLHLREGIPYQTANRLPDSNQRLPEILDGCHPPGGSQPEISSQYRHKAHSTRSTWKQAGTGRGEVVLHLKRVRSSSTWLPELLGPREQHKTQAQLSLCHCGVPENLNLSSLDLGSARNSGPAPCRATWSLSSVDGEST